MAQQEKKDALPLSLKTWNPHNERRELTSTSYPLISVHKMLAHAYTHVHIRTHSQAHTQKMNQCNKS